MSMSREVPVFSNISMDYLLFIDLVSMVSMVSVLNVGHVVCTTLVRIRTIWIMTTSKTPPRKTRK